MKATIGKWLVFGAVAAAIALPATASAGEVHNRVHRQHQRIQQGVQSGQMTQAEAQRSRERLQAINAQRGVWLKAQDGKLTAAQQIQLNRELNANSRQVFFEKHNLSNRPGAPDPHFARRSTVPPSNMQGIGGPRVQRQWDRLQTGVDSGQLTQAEFSRDRARLQYINRQRLDWLAHGNGTLTVGQRNQLRDELNNSSNTIWWTKHNLPDQPGV
jgi:flagellar biosynthesis regulator FlaF